MRAQRPGYLERQRKRMVKFEQCYPRTSSFINPATVNDPEYRRRYKALSRKCVFPAAYGNGIFHIGVGLALCIPGLATMFFASQNTGLRPITIGVGLVIGIVLAYFYCSYVQTRALFPRGGSMPVGMHRVSIGALVIPILAFIAAAVFAWFNANPAFPAIVAATVLALINTVAYAHTAKPFTLVLSFIMQWLPYLLFMAGRVSQDPFNATASTVGYIGLLFVMIGVFSTMGSMGMRPGRYNREQVRSFLTADNPAHRFMALCFLCSNVDANLLPEIAACCRDEDETVAHTAQIAFGNAWGPKPRELYVSVDEMVANVPERYRGQYREQVEAQRRAILERWLKINEIVEQKVVQIAEEDGPALENVYALASGQDVRYPQARIVALEMLGLMRTPRAYATLMNGLQHRSKSVAQAAVNGFFGADSKAVLYLEKFFTGPRAWIRRRAIDGARTMLEYLEVFDQDEAAVARALLEPDIDGLFNSDDTGTFAATITLLPAEERADLDVLEQYCENDRPIVRIAALSTIARQRPDAAAKWIVPSMSHPSAAVRYAAIVCAEQIGLPDRAQQFQRLLHDRNPRVAARAMQALERLQNLVQPQNPWG